MIRTINVQHGFGLATTYCKIRFDFMTPGNNIIHDCIDAPAQIPAGSTWRIETLGEEAIAASRTVFRDGSF